MPNQDTRLPVEFERLCALAEKVYNDFLAEIKKLEEEQRRTFTEMMKQVDQRKIVVLKRRLRIS